ncbi:MAG: tRNA uridine(34) 5-carboxymethylaminomethyl modification radical SAM/GNAT enzyme Elp3, partial [Patescibacteria group bacterium]
MSIAEKILVKLAQRQYKNTDEFFSYMRSQFSNFDMAPLRKATLISTYRQLLARKKIRRNEHLEAMLRKGAIRTLSGVTVVTVLTKPYACPGKCVFCPTEPNMPKSYLSNEPAAQRAVRLRFDPFEQVQKRIKALEVNGHDVDKIEIIVLGGTWSSYPRDYRDEFIRQCFYAANTYFTPSTLPLKKGEEADVGSGGSVEGVSKRRRPKTLAAEQKINETAKYKIIGLTLETRSDHVTESEIKHLRELGCTRIQLGVQHTDNDILKLNRRGEYVEDDITATELLKRAGFKVDHHYMPDLPGSTPAKDRAMFKRVFTGTDLQPDQVKIYPCVVNEYAQLYHWYKSGKYKPYPEKELIKLLLDVKKMVPPYVRINRLIRDIPEESIIAGNDVTNLRQYLQRELTKRGTPCKCIRCREVRADTVDVSKAVLKKRTYRASHGTEHFLSYESPDESKIYAFLRLRFNDEGKKHFIPELKGAALVRELHVYGLMLPVSSKA